MKTAAALLTAAAMITGTARSGGAPGPVDLTTIMYVVEGGGSSATLEWPLVLGAGSEDAVTRMNAALSYEAMTGETLEQTLANFSECQRGVVGTAYVVNLNEAGILDITISVDFLGAYPSTFPYYINLDAATGLPLAVDGLFDPAGQDDLAALLDGMLRARIAEAVDIYCEGVEEYGWMYQGFSFTRDNLGSLTIGPDGVTFHYDFAFPHVAAAAEPDGELSLDWEALEPFMAVDSPLRVISER